jgi:ubiquinone/menaquinone biosynthesis C-methylase UbiE
VSSKDVINIDSATVSSFSDEWTRFDQSGLATEECRRIFESYFSIFPWASLRPHAEGFDMGCGSGRWANLVASRVGKLNCIDASADALVVARRTLAEARNVEFFHASVDTVPLEPGSQDFGYSLGVLHHVPNTAGALRSCIRLLKPGAPFLVYMYYRFDNRPMWFRTMWVASEAFRAVVSRLPAPVKQLVTDATALTIYWPLARMSLILHKVGLNTSAIPLQFYRNKSFYTMRTDSRDRFGTPLEQRFTREEIRQMMEESGLKDVQFSNFEPYWCAVGVKQ